MTTDEARKLIAKTLRQKCFTDIVPGGIGLRSVPKDCVKMLCESLGLWEELSRDLTLAKLASRRQKSQGRAVAVAETKDPINDLFHCAWIVVYVIYEGGVLVRCDCVMIICDSETTYESGHQTAAYIAQNFLSS